MHGMEVCASHGGMAPQVKAAAARRLALAEAQDSITRWGGRMDITPAEALLQLVQSKAAEVAYWQHEVDEVDMVAGLMVTKTEQGAGPQGPVDTETAEAVPHITLVLLHKAQDQLAAYSTAALKAGVDERLVRMAEAQGAVVVRILDRTVAAVQQALGATLEPDVVQQIITTAIEAEAA